MIKEIVVKGTPKEIEMELRSSGVRGPTSPWIFGETLTDEELKTRAKRKFNITPETIKDIESGKDVWLRNNISGVVACAGEIKRCLSDEQTRLWERAGGAYVDKPSVPLGKAYWMNNDSGLSRGPGGALEDWLHSEVIEFGPHISSLALVSDPAFVVPVIITGHALSRLKERGITQQQVVQTCIHGAKVTRDCIDADNPDHRVVKRMDKETLCRHGNIPNDLIVVCKKNYKGSWVEVITAYWEGSEKTT